MKIYDDKSIRQLTHINGRVDIINHVIDDVNKHFHGTDVQILKLIKSEEGAAEYEDEYLSESKKGLAWRNTSLLSLPITNEKGDTCHIKAINKNCS